MRPHSTILNGTFGIRIAVSIRYQSAPRVNRAAVDSLDKPPNQRSKHPYLRYLSPVAQHGRPAPSTRRASCTNPNRRGAVSTLRRRFQRSPLAVDEASTILVRHARPSPELTCIFDVDTDDRLNVKLAVRADAPINLTTASFGWILLRTLVDDVILEQSPTAVEEDRTVTITLIKAL